MKTTTIIKSILTGILAWIPAVFLLAQGLHIQQTTPTNLSLVDLSQGSITIDFNQPISTKKINKHIKVFGEWTGPKDFDFELQSNDQRLVMYLNVDEDRPNAGEKLTITISNKLQAKSGTQLSDGYAIQYFVASTQGTLIQKRKATIPLRKRSAPGLQSVGTYAGDLNNDGFSDLTVLNELSADLRILINNQEGSYEKPQVLSMDVNDRGTNRAADFDNDGTIDLAVGASFDQLNVLMGNGWGGFARKGSIVRGNTTKGLTILDIDGDGDEDIALANANQSKLSLFTNDGKGNFTHQLLDIPGINPSAVEAADANNDGKLDLFVGSAQSKSISILLGDGDGGFLQSSEVKVVGQPWMLAVADLNGDHFADVASVNAKGNVTVVIFGDGRGGLHKAQTYALPNAKMPKAIDLGDIDGDGDMDMVTANYESNNFVVWENNALGVMSRASVLSAVRNPASVVLTDQDNDGDLDIIGTDATTDEVLIFDNAPDGSEIYAQLEGSITAQISPNPFWNRLKIKIYVPRTGRTDVRILDASGRLMERLWDDRLTAGEHYFGWDGRSPYGAVPTGIYYVSVTQNGKTFTWPVSKG